MTVFNDLKGNFLEVTQLAAIEAARAAGHGNKDDADQASVGAMRYHLGRIRNTKIVVQIGEGERDKAPMLHIGEVIGSGSNTVYIAVDPLENTNATANLGPNAVCVLAAAPQGGLISASDGYMNKLIVGPKVAGKVDIRSDTETIISTIAEVLNREKDDLTITVLDRERNNNLVKEIRNTGARVQLIPDGDLVPGILTCISGSSTHAVMGIGASPEGVITAASVKVLGGSMQAVFWPKDEKDKDRLTNMGIDLKRVYTEKDLAPGSDIIVCVTAVTSVTTATKHFLDGVSFFGGGARTNSLVLDGNSMSTVITTHIVDKVEFLSSGSEFRMF